MPILQYITPGASDKRRRADEEAIRLHEIQAQADAEIKRAKEVSANQAEWAATQKERDANAMQGTLFNIFMRDHPDAAAAANSGDIATAEAAQKAARDYAFAETDKMKASGALATSAIDMNRYNEASGGASLAREVGSTNAISKVQTNKADFQDNLVRAEKSLGAVTSAFGLGQSGARRGIAENMAGERIADESYLTSPLTGRADRALAGWRERAAQNKLKMEMGNNTDLEQRAHEAELGAGIAGSEMLTKLPALKYAPYMFQPPSQSQVMGGIMGGAAPMQIPQQFLGGTNSVPAPMGTSAMPGNAMNSGSIINAPVQLPSQTPGQAAPALNLNEILRLKALRQAQGGK